MNCEQCQRLLLTSADPARPPEEAGPHLAICAVCRDAARRLTRLEQAASQLPTPPSRRRQAFMRGFLNPVRPMPAPINMPAAGRLRASLRRWLPLSVAAAVLIAVGLWLGTWAARSFRTQEPVATVPAGKKAPSPAPDRREAKEEKLPETSLAAMVLECDLELAGTSDPVRRVEVLAKLGHQLRGESRWLAKASADKELSRLSHLHTRVLKEGLLLRAKFVPVSERKRTLEPIARELAASQADMRDLTPRVGFEAGRRLEEMARTTEQTALALRELMAEATP